MASIMEAFVRSPFNEKRPPVLPEYFEPILQSIEKGGHGLSQGALAIQMGAFEHQRDNGPPELKPGWEAMIDRLRKVIEKETL